MKTATIYTDWHPGDTAKFYRQPRRIGPVGNRKQIPGRWDWGIIQSITGNLYDQDDNGVIGPFRLATLVNPLSDERAFVGVGDLRPAGFEYVYFKFGDDTR